MECYAGKKGKPFPRLLAMIVALALCLSTFQVTVFAEDAPRGTSSKIISFSPLAADIASQTVALGTSKSALTLPETLTAAVQIGAAETEALMSVPAVWEVAPAYNGDTPGIYTFTAAVGESFCLAVDAILPTITVTVLQRGIESDVAAQGITMAAFDRLPDEVLWQGYDMGTVTSHTELLLPDTLIGTDSDGSIVTIESITWQSEPEFDPGVSAHYYFMPVLPQGYITAGGAKVPVISVFLRPEGGVRPEPMTVGNTFTDSGFVYYVVTESGATGTVALYQNSYNETSYTIPSTVTNGSINYTVTSIGDQAFQNCTALTSVTLPGSLTTIGTSAFDGCTSLAAVELMSTTPPALDGSEFLNTAPGLLVIVPAASLNAYQQTTFAGMLPTDATIIGEDGSIPVDATFVKDDIKYKVLTNDAGSNTVEVVPNHYPKTSYTIPETVSFHSTSFTVTKIGDNSFENCAALTSVILPGSISSIGESAFKNTQITAITLPASLNSLNNSAFYSCTALKTVRFKGTPPSSLGSGIFDATLGCTIIVPRGTLPIFQLAFRFQNYTYIRDEAIPVAGTGLASDNVKQISMTLNWNATNDGGITADSAIKYYIYQSDSDNIETVANCEANGTLLNAGGTAGITTFDVTGLTASTIYWFNVIAENIDGNKAGYTSFSVTTSDKDPISGTVSIHVTQGGNTRKIDAGDILTADVNGIYPANAQSTLRYQWYRGASPISGATTGSYTVGSLSVDSAGTEISVKVTGTVDIYTGTLQSVAVVVDTASLDGRISITGNTILASSLTLDTSGLLPSEATYTMQWYRDGTIITGQTGQSYTLVKADLGKTISIVISGTENYSGSLSAQKTIPVIVPESPGNLQGVARNGEALLSWSAPFDGGCSITKYEVSKDGGTNWTDVGIVTRYTVAGLTNNTSITLQVRAVNVIGNGSAASVTVTPAPAFTQRTLTDPTTGITVSGVIDATAILTVQPISMPPAGTSAAWDSVRKLETERKGHLYLVDINLIGGYSGEMTVSFRVDASYNGKKLDVCHISGSTLETYSPTVENGVAAFKVNSFSPFAVYAQTQRDNGDGGTYSSTTPTSPQTGDSSNLGLWLALMCMAVLVSSLAAWQLLKRKKNNKVEK